MHSIFFVGAMLLCLFHNLQSIPYLNELRYRFSDKELLNIFLIIFAIVTIAHCQTQPPDSRNREVGQIGEELFIANSDQLAGIMFSFVIDTDIDTTLNALSVYDKDLRTAQIGITPALFLRLEKEPNKKSLIAAIIGHEMGHIIQQAQPDILLTLPIRDKKIIPVTIQMNVPVDSTTRELKADAFGVSCLKKAGLDPASMQKILIILKNEGIKNYGHSHPSIEERIANLQEILKIAEQPSRQY